MMNKRAVALINCLLFSLQINLYCSSDDMNWWQVRGLKPEMQHNHFIMRKWKIAAILLLTALSHHATADDPMSIVGDELEGPNVCKHIENYNVTVVVTEMTPYQETKMVWCAQIPPRCRKTEIKLRQVNKTEVLEKMRAVRACCVGYIENNQRNGCVPHCQKPCINGVCASPGQCKCESGFGGPSCDISKFTKRFPKTISNFIFLYRLSSRILRQEVQEEVRLF